MGSFTMQYMSASVKIHVWGDGEATVSNLFARERRQGHATELMRQVVELADDQDWKLVLAAKEYGQPKGPGNDKLVEFYQNFGFRKDDVLSPVHFMERLPRANNMAFNETHLTKETP